ncbi:hypothetical protein FPSE_04178 [Fusarium pseudograminearum CS3096]|uniref:Uncharacterized protein n=1 Tax=Fusarium pseudograminearum (strain CS3096) TaxID=1028729 RepID=K3VL74_FUSPC|nr:hypothetical protein FPSE_04178 [Fusarium pseudograminearum CS3096]EKJ75677.1 hypothetical protein FPSE_04178 [Fusarium pseudograminearum CS3096]
MVCHHRKQLGAVEARIWTVLSSAYQYSWLPTAWGHVLLFKAALVVQIPVLAN